MAIFLEHVNKRDLNKRLFETFGKYKVFIVDGQAIRKLNLTDHEFTDSAIHATFPKLIPDKEIWIDDVIKPNERFILISNLLSLYKYLSKESLDKAYDKALKKEKSMREKVDNVRLHPEKTNERASPKVYKSLYGKIGDVKIWLVDGEYVRDKYKTDYTEGGHDYVYKWIPHNEIWIESTMHKSEMPLIVLHEFVERTLMKTKGIEYDKAHTIASKVEFAKEDKFDRNDVLSMTEDKALKMDETRVVSN